MYDPEELKALCRPVAEYLRTKCSPPMRAEVTDYGVFVHRGEGQPDYYAELP